MNPGILSGKPAIAAWAALFLVAASGALGLPGRGEPACLAEAQIVEQAHWEQVRILADLDASMRSKRRDERQLAIAMHRAKQAIRQDHLARRLADNARACATRP